MPTNTARIAKNTLMLYFRQILLMLVSLYTVRVVLNTLGAEDYGIYNVVAGVVTMFGFLSDSMATASQRYFSFELGRGDFEQLKRVFNVTITIYAMIGVLVLLMAETVGLWFVSNKLVIPLERKSAALWVYHSSMLSFLFTILAMPYMAAIVSHEDMNIYAYMSIFEAALKLIIVFFLQFILWDKLKLYGVLYCVVIIVNTMMYCIICMIRYKECKFKIYWNKKLIKEITSYTGWTLFGSIGWIAKNQGINILLNLFFGPLLNAAKGIASQVNSVITSFSNNFMKAVYPQIVKSYVNKNTDYMWKLIFTTSKVNFYLLLVIGIPVCLETEFIMDFWLKNVPDYICTYIRFTMIDILLNSFSNTMGPLNQASGNIKLYQLFVGGFLTLNLPLSFCLLLFIRDPFIPMIVAIFLTIFSMVSRLLILKSQLNFPVSFYLKRVMIIVLLVSIAALFLPVLLIMYMPPSWFRFCLSTLMSVLGCLFAIWFFGIDKNERFYILNLLKLKIMF
jgi:O-antigen/teichoic acid export membrane protein